MRLALASFFRFVLLATAVALANRLPLAAQGFAPPALFPTTAHPIFLETSDIDANGSPDLLYIDVPGTTYPNPAYLHVLPGDGHGGFKETYASPVLASSVAAGDMLGTGHLDYGYIAAATASPPPTTAFTDVVLFAGVGDGTFHDNAGTTGDFNVFVQQSPAFRYLQAVHLASTGPPSFIAQDIDNELLVTFQAGSATFPPTSGFTWHESSPLPGGAGPALTADLNGDGKPDLVVNGQTGYSASVYFGNGDGTFQAPTTYVFDHNVHSLLLADMDGDGHPDLIVEGDSGAIEIFHGNPDGTFAKTSEGGTAPLDASTGNGGHLIAAADLNHDGKPDLIAWTPLGVSVLLNQGGGAFKLNGIYPAGSAAPTQFVVADFNGDGYLDLALDAPGGISILYGQATPSVTTTLTASPEPSNFEAAFTLTATLTAPASQPVPSGSVTFSIPQPNPSNGPAPPPMLQTVTLQNGVASYAVPAVQPSTGGTGFLPGADTLTASYSGDANYAPIASFTGTHRVNLGVTGVTLTPAPPLNALLSTYYYGQPVNGYVNFQPQDPTYPVTGTWAQLSNGVAVPGCTAIPATTAGSCPYGYPQLLDAGSYNFVEAYNGDPINGPGQSSSYNFNVVPDITTSVGLTSSIDPAIVGTAVTFTATFTGNDAVPTGSVTFMDANSVLGTAPLNASGVAVLTTSALAIGIHPITAVYPGNIDFNPATSAVLNQQILAIPAPVATTVALTSSLNPSDLGQLVSFTATVAAPGTSSPAGMVAFSDGSAILGAVSLTPAGPNASLAVFSISTLAVGTHPITASYAGQPGSGLTPALLPAVSPVLDQVVAIPVQTNFTLTVTPNPATVPAGQTAVFKVTLTPPANDSLTPVTLTCGDSIQESSCSFLNQVIPLGGGSTTMTLATAAPHSCGTPTQTYAHQGPLQASCTGAPAAAFRTRMTRGLSLAMPLLGAAIFLWPRKRRKHWKLLTLSLTLSSLLSLSGCSGNCTDLGTPLRSYTFTVTGVSSAAGTTGFGPPVTQTVAVKLTVIPQ